ncbi:hypothetical protein QFC20_005365 [Naganishia adeliensis]|uniref:Uncharacterized protein n=1 Tax=Naganishia adeliensis TaxID=92952 RepID=A0ACC2VQ83_9TREE|nr:hypothetical protein QFC20_005365 [Naganishia adeliensis]
MSSSQQSNSVASTSRASASQPHQRFSPSSAEGRSNIAITSRKTVPLHGQFTKARSGEGSKRQKDVVRLTEENRLLRARLEATQARERERELLATFEPIERPSEAGDNDYDVAPTRRVLGLDLLPGDPDLVKILKNQTWNYLRASIRDTILEFQLDNRLTRGASWEETPRPVRKALRQDLSSDSPLGG